MAENRELQDILESLNAGFKALQTELQLSRFELGEKIDQTNARLDQTNARLDQTNARLDQTNARLDQTNARLDQTNARLDQTNARLDETNVRLDQTNVNLHEFQLEMRHTLSGLSTFLLSSEQGYRSLEDRVYNLERWREDMDRRKETG